MASDDKLDFLPFHLVSEHKYVNEICQVDKNFTEQSIAYRDSLALGGRGGGGSKS